MSSSRRKCLDCGLLRRHAGRGICATCRSRRVRDGTLEERPVIPKLSAKPFGELSYRQLDYWTRQGYLVADVANPGSGVPRTWSDGERAIAALMQALTAAGFRVAAAATIARDSRCTVELALGITLHIDSQPEGSDAS